MYQVKEFDQQGLHFFRLTDGISYVDICPERGGMVTAFHTNGEDVLFMNEATLFDTSKNVRGGIPVLFPIAGQLTNKSYEWEGVAYSMDNHGLARTRAWKVADQSADSNHSALKITFHSSEDTRESYPFDFEAMLTYTLSDGELTISQTINNLSSESMPVYPGYHPYFKMTDQQLHLKSKAVSYLDYNDHETKPFNGEINMKGLKESVVLLNSGDPQLVFDFNATKKIVISQDPRYRYTVLWVEGNQPFVCVEPWTALTNTLNEKKDDLLMVTPDEPLELSIAIRLSDR